MLDCVNFQYTYDSLKPLILKLHMEHDDTTKTFTPVGIKDARDRLADHIKALKKHPKHLLTKLFGELHACMHVYDIWCTTMAVVPRVLSCACRFCTLSALLLQRDILHMYSLSDTSSALCRVPVPPAT